MLKMQKVWLGFSGMAIALLGCGLWLHAAEKETETDVAVNRTRKQVLMLDDVYKTAVVLITDKYVNKPTDFAAGSAAIALFDAIKKKGHARSALAGCDGAPLR